MLSIRMRASKKKAHRPEHGGCGNNCSSEHPETEIHISGAEGLFDGAEMIKVVGEYIERALTHPRGEPDKITITIEKVKVRAKMVRALPVTTVKCTSPSLAESHIRSLLGRAGISAEAVETAFAVVRKDEAMRGAAIICGRSGRRVEGDKARGVRASRLGIGASVERDLRRKLDAEGIDTITVREAVILASKVASCRDIIAELCISDDPDYTTGYVASAGFGYVRIPHIKRKGSRKGGRVFFVSEEANVADVEEYIERKPVVIGSTDECKGVRSIDEILDSPDR